MTRLWRVLGLNCFLIITLSGHASLAQDARAEAKKHYQRALELVDEKAYDQALVEFQRAYEASPNHSVLFQMGEAHVLLGNPVEAVDSYQQYLKDGGNKIAAARRSEVEKKIEWQKARIAVLDIRVSSPGATIKVDGKVVGTSPLASPLRIPLGRHIVSAFAEGFQASEQTVTVAGEEQRSVELVLKELPKPPAPVVVRPTGQLLVQCEISDVLLEVDGKPVGKTPFSAAIQLDQGPHALRFSRPGYLPKSHRVTVSAGQLSKSPCEVVPSAVLTSAEAGRLVILPSEPGAAVKVDGIPLPTDGIVPMGTHRVTVSRDGFQPWTKEVNLSPGHLLTVDAHLVPTLAHLHDYESSTRSQRTWAYVLGVTGLALEGAALGAYLWNDGRFGDWETENASLEQAWAEKPPYPTDLSARQDKNDERIRDIHTWDAVTVGLAVGGTAMLGGAVFLFVTGDDPDRYENLVVQPAKEGAVLGWTSKF